MKTIYLWDEEEGWKCFNFDSRKIKKELKLRGITIGNDATIGDDAKIGYDATIGNNATIGDNATIGNCATIGDDATIGNCATIGYDAKIGNNATIGDNEIIIKTIFITGSRHPVLWYGKNVIQVGCKRETIDWWLSEGEEAGKKEGYSEAELQEYKQYFLICKQLQESIDNQYKTYYGKN